MSTIFDYQVTRLVFQFLVVQFCQTLFLVSDLTSLYQNKVKGVLHFIGELTKSM